MVREMPTTPKGQCAGCQHHACARAAQQSKVVVHWCSKYRPRASNPKSEQGHK
jgi:hypothetical protein